MTESAIEQVPSSTNKAVVEEPTTVLDLREVPVKVGDKIAYAATDGRSSGLRVGRVTEILPAREVKEYYDVQVFYTRNVPTKLRVEVELSSGYDTPTKPVLIEAGFKRFVRLD